MYIEKIECKKCKRKGWPGVEFNLSLDQVLCKCGYEFSVEGLHDKCVLSSNPFVRLSTLSDYHEHGTVELKPGKTKRINFRNNCEFPGKVYFTPYKYILDVKELFIKTDHMDILSSIPDAPENSEIAKLNLGADNVKVSWSIYGISNSSTHKSWFILFYSATTNLENRFYKAAVLEYATAFELFIEDLLFNNISKRYDNKISEYLLKKTKGIERRLADIYPLVFSKRITQEKKIYDHWDRDVRQLRNRLAHGKGLEITREHAENAHQAVYQAVRWIEDNAEQVDQ